MECVSSRLDSQDISAKSQTTASKRKRAKSQKRRRNGANDDFSVNFSKIKVSESNRVLRSRARRIEITTHDKINDTPKHPQTDAVSKDHSYSKASKTMTRQRNHQLNTPTVHLKLFIDLSSSKDNNHDHTGDMPKDTEQNYYCRNHKIEIIDFDDLELSNPSFEENSPKLDYNSNDPHFANRNKEQDINEASKNPSNSPKSDDAPEAPPEKNHKTEDSDKAPNEDDSDPCRSSKTEFEALLAKYGDVDVYQSKSTVFLEEPLWMSDVDLNPHITIDGSSIDRSTSQSPVYLDLDQNHDMENTSLTPFVCSSSTGPMNFPSGGCFQRLEAVRTLTMTRPSQAKYMDATSDLSYLPKDIPIFSNPLECLLPSPMGQTPTNEFQSVIAQRLASVVGPTSDTFSNHKSDDGSGVLSVNFPTSGGSIERIFSPEIPRQPSALKKYPGISSIPYGERNVPTANHAPESISIDNQNSQQPECRIHLVDTPPSFTRTSQPEVSQIMSRPRHTTPRPTSDILSCARTPLKTSSKPKRTRRTRAQMEVYRQEMARSYNDRKRNQRFAPRASGHIFGRNFSMEYRRVHSQPQEFVYTARMPPRFQPIVGCQTQRYSETYSLNETSLFGVSSNLDEWPQTLNHFPGFSHDMDDLWTLSPVMKNFAPTEAGRETPTSSSVMWNQQIRSYTTVQQGPLGNSRILQTERRSYTPWHQSLEQLPGNLNEITNDGGVNEMQYYLD